MPLRRRFQVALITLLGALFFGLLSPTAPAHAEPEPEVSTEPEPEVSTPDPWDRFLSVSIVGGADTPWGVVGGNIDLAFIRYFSLYVGGGVSPDGGRVASGLRVKYPFGNGAVGIRGGVSGGRLTWNNSSPEVNGLEQVFTRRTYDFPVFIHFALEFEYRWDSGVFFRLSLGTEALVAEGPETSCTVSDGECRVTDLSNPNRAWAGLAVGYALDL